MNVNSANVIYNLRKTYERFGKSYDFLLQEYSPVIYDIQAKVYIEHSKNIKGLVLLDGCNVNFSTAQLTQLFMQHGICTIIIACLTPTERERTIRGTGDAEKCIRFENYSILRYFEDFFLWLKTMRNDKRRQNEKLIVCNFTQYNDIKLLLDKNKKYFYIVKDLAYLQNICNY